MRGRKKEYSMVKRLTVVSIVHFLPICKTILIEKSAVQNVSVLLTKTYQSKYMKYCYCV